MSDSPQIAPLLFAWYGRVGRDLPWRHTRAPYRIWLSEIMLQQTTVTAVIPYYQCFLARFPDIGVLAAAAAEEVVEAWAGLGYYSRARNLHAAARQVMELHNGCFPETLEELITLPGIGRSTAGAILAIAHQERGVILDGNVRRVLVRLFALEGDPRSSAAEKQLWLWAESLTPAERADDYAQAIMDLGATCCTPTKPNCPECPLAVHCQAFTQGRQDELPQARAAKAVPTVQQVGLLLADKRGRLLVRRRPMNGLLGGLWEFPTREVLPGATPEASARLLLQELGGSGSVEEAGKVAHAYSHFKLDLRFYRGKAGTAGYVGEGEHDWLTAAALRELALHGAHKKALKFI
ncbi:MAG: A/G-specific adenine glycosylase [Desulfuromonadales bacterium GWC2_61_20]|nr:MAG: A/G-specific adenine glycosylase [Desulfuromonadales bacterium GWC2_61_20]